MDNIKYKELIKKKEEAVIKLELLYKGFHGVRHEDSASEIRYTQIKVLEDYINSINEELKLL